MRSKKEKRRLPGILTKDREIARNKDIDREKKLTAREIIEEFIRALISILVNKRLNIVKLDPLVL
ncbi:hypothetical protein A3C25_01110 [Candidatus Roizmanbacteria bacterium RIFCSPHIGHO2_02_FULL_38_11]|uniref:Uncharacterized protein n=1 Tax=Candidatus Roizmanbacteria bacterium RIFCSPHIGHO2_02_FULL_38_11 TaxID=1802039 RepID=A0A1F7H3B6_9BACT|nr:MAG: hypothetical protein A3C25_01110 [Candidatus Roizmanbacteria bacterium RIFCSPHIGHO2_02_FULL_38_11]